MRIKREYEFEFTWLQVILFVLSVFAAIVTFGQEVITAKNFDPHEAYILQYPTGTYIHPKGYHGATIMVKAQSTGKFYQTAIKQEYLDGMKPGDEVELRQTNTP